MKNIVLVHAAWQGAYVWEPVKTRLEKMGYRVAAVNLPGHSHDTAEPENLTMNHYRDAVVEVINKIRGKVILVGHSLGGMVISAVAERIPDKIDKLVYLAAFVPANGQSLKDLSEQDDLSLAKAHMVFSEDRLTADIPFDKLTTVFYHDVADDLLPMVLENHKAEPLIPIVNPVVLTEQNFGRVNKYYIHALQDRAITLKLQQQMVADAGITHTYSLETGHIPHLAMPKEVASIIHDIAH